MRRGVLLQPRTCTASLGYLRSDGTCGLHLCRPRGLHAVAEFGMACKELREREEEESRAPEVHGSRKLTRARADDQCSARATCARSETRSAGTFPGVQ